MLLTGKLLMRTGTGRELLRVYWVENEATSGVEARSFSGHSCSPKGRVMESKCWGPVKHSTEPTIRNADDLFCPSVGIFVRPKGRVMESRFWDSTEPTIRDADDQFCKSIT